MLCAGGLLGLLCAPIARAQSGPSISAPTLSGIDSLINAEFAKDSLGSITAGVIAGPQLAWTHSYGFADMKTHRLASRGTVYRIGSITKMFTGVMLLQLIADGKIQLSDPVERYLPEIKQIGSKPPGAPPFTFLQLATMTAGLAREPREEGPFWTGPVADWQKTLISALPHTDYRSFPGTEYAYSNIGYAILGAALSRVAGVPYTEWERTRVFEPLGMQRTRFEIDPTIAPDLATGYMVNGDGTLSDSAAAHEGRDGRGFKVPNGAIFTTVDDLARFVAFELGHGPASVLPPERLDSAFHGFVAASADLQQGYGLGFMAMRRDTLTWVGHNGAVAGYVAYMYFDRDRQLGVVLFRNVMGGKEDPGRLATDILSRLVAARNAAVAAAFAKRFKDQTPDVGSDVALRRLIGELRLGKPNYALMSYELAGDVRQELAHEQAKLASLGALESLTFKGVGPGGADIYTATFEHGALEYRIWLTEDDRILYANDRPTSSR
ncbi:MAG TPA: serine hydrolase domain-containing protein [Gemmatimonadaceae bacterium]|jgi:CubicO group peptidase (beta-lactamase class C family)|nr:serine hydrolase domain-containing protein [Gemmatimonadaceae bacterium]